MNPKLNVFMALLTLQFVIIAAAISSHVAAWSSRKDLTRSVAAMTNLIDKTEIALDGGVMTASDIRDWRQQRDTHLESIGAAKQSIEQFEWAASFFVIVNCPVAIVAAFYALRLHRPLHEANPNEPPDPPKYLSAGE